MARDPNAIQLEILRHEADLKILKNELKEATKGMVECKSCHTFYNPDNLAVGSYDTTATETVFVDAGYGDDDELAEVTRRHIVKRCPKCGYEMEHKDYYLGETNRRCRTKYK